MSSLLSINEKSRIQEIFNNIFDTFSRSITVYKEPKKVLNTSSNNPGVFGFGTNQTNDTYSYLPVTGIFQAEIRKGNVSLGSSESNINPNLNTVIYNGDIAIKVKEDCRNFINKGKTEKIIIDNLTYYLTSQEEKQTTFGNAFYIFELKQET